MLQVSQIYFNLTLPILLTDLRKTNDKAAIALLNFMCDRNIGMKIYLKPCDLVDKKSHIKIKSFDNLQLSRTATSFFFRQNINIFHNVTQILCTYWAC